MNDKTKWWMIKLSDEWHLFKTKQGQVSTLLSPLNLGHTAST